MQFKLNLININKSTLEKTIDSEQDYEKFKESLLTLENELHLLNEQLKNSGFKDASLIELKLSLPETQESQEYCTNLEECVKLLRSQIKGFPKDSVLLLALYITTFNKIGGITEEEWLALCETFYAYIPEVVRKMRLGAGYEEVLKQRLSKFLNDNVKGLIRIIPHRDSSDDITRNITEIFLDCKKDYNQFIEKESSDEADEVYSDLVDFFDGDKTKVC